MCACYITRTCCSVMPCKPGIRWRLLGAMLAAALLARY